MISHWPYLIILAVIALIIFGPKRLPELGEGLGKAIREFRKATSEMGESLKTEVHAPDTATGTTYPAIQAAPAAAATTEPQPAPPVAAAPPPATLPPPEPPKS